MNYIKTVITNVELALLEIIKEKDETDGYEIKKILEERGYANWANIGKTSIYTGIKKLKKKDLITIKTLKRKEGKGPLPNKISLTKSGEKVLVEEIRKALLSQKNLPLYYLGIAGIGLIKKDVASELLEQRKIINRKIIEKLKDIFKKQGGNKMSLEAQALFEHPILLIQSDIKFINRFIKKLQEYKNEN